MGEKSLRKGYPRPPPLKPPPPPPPDPPLFIFSEEKPLSLSTKSSHILLSGKDPISTRRPRPRPPFRINLAAPTPLTPPSGCPHLAEDGGRVGPLRARSGSGLRAPGRARTARAAAGGAWRGGGGSGSFPRAAAAGCGVRGPGWAGAARREGKRPAREGAERRAGERRGRGGQGSREARGRGAPRREAEQRT